MIGEEEIPPLRSKLCNRNILGEIFAELDYKVGAEIGVSTGLFSEVLLRANPGLKFYCVDPWLAYETYPSQRKNNRYFEETKQRLSPYNVEYLRMTSMDALKKIPDNSLDFVYIDAIHDFDHLMMDIIGWSYKVRSGGIISGHDYCKGYPEVPLAVDAYVKVKNLCLFLTNERYSSWFFVKL